MRDRSGAPGGGSFAANGVACGHASSRLEKIVEADRRCAVYPLRLGQWSAAGLRLSAENCYLRFFTFAGSAMAIRGF
ncbi:hypothetical protein NQ317_000865 [Molorchus minor]|uniref:Uncharacterized protein n=1 Tax=Molorchus minor TaxID=1323400 RepID=A0ABQ9JW65_9CUCU|nr:hypothetical protein NQ317_000865 [Molorchus minor]